MPREGIRDILRRRLFAGFLAVFLLDHIAEICWLISFTWVASEPGGWKTGLVLAAGAVPAIVFTLPGGAISDLFGSRCVAAYSMAARAAAFAAWAAVAATGDVPLLAAAAAAILIGLIAGVHDPAMTAYPRALLGRQGIESAAIVIRLAMRIAQGVGGYLAGALIALLWVGSPAAAGAILAAGCAVALFRMRAPAGPSSTGSTPTEPSRRKRVRTAWRTEIHEGLTYIRRHEVLRWTIPTQFAINLLSSAVLIALLPLKARASDWSSTQYGAAFALYGVGMVLSTLLVAAMRHWSSRARIATAMVCATAMAICGVLLVLMSTYALCAALTGLIGLTLGPVGTILTGYAQAVAPEHLFARVGSVVTVATTASEPLGWLFVGGFSSLMGLTDAGLLLCALTLAVILVCLVGVARDVVLHKVTQGATLR